MRERPPRTSRTNARFPSTTLFRSGACRQQGVRFGTPIAKPSRRLQMQAAIDAHAPGRAWTLGDGQAREAMRAADAVLITSGTATLECLLLGRPMVVAYRGAALTAWLLLSAGMLKRSEEHTSELQSLMRISYAVFCLKKKNITT